MTGHAAPGRQHLHPRHVGRVLGRHAQARPTAISARSRRRPTRDGRAVRRHRPGDVIGIGAARLDAPEPGRAAATTRHAGHRRSAASTASSSDRRAKRGMLRAIAALPGAFPLTNYTPDFAPLSIGNQSQRLVGAADAELPVRIPAGTSTASTRVHVARGRDARPAVLLHRRPVLPHRPGRRCPTSSTTIVSAGYLKHDLNANVSFSQQTTQGGGDIRRQDMPFVSNRMNFSRVGAMAMYPIPKLNTLAFQFAAGTHARRPQRRTVDDVYAGDPLLARLIAGD